MEYKLLDSEKSLETHHRTNWFYGAEDFVRFCFSQTILYWKHINTPSELVQWAVKVNSSISLESASMVQSDWRISLWNTNQVYMYSEKHLDA